VYHLAIGLFFTLVLAGAGFLFSLTIREYWDEILAALKGEMPRRRTARPWTKKVRVTVRPRPIAAPALARRRAAV
jgi:hypothetical protein